MNELNIFGKFVLPRLSVTILDRKIQREILGWKKFIKKKVEKTTYTKYATMNKESFELKVESWWDN